MAYVDGTVDKPIFGLANSDSHNTGDPDSTVGAAKNGVYLWGPLNQKQLLKAIKAGRTFGTTGPSLDLQVNGRLMGGTAHIIGGAATVDLSANSESDTALLVKIDVIKNGELWQTLVPMSQTYADSLVDDGVTEDGYYRIEVTSVDMESGNTTFAWSNPVFVQVRNWGP